MLQQRRSCIAKSSLVAYSVFDGRVLDHECISPLTKTQNALPQIKSCYPRICMLVGIAVVLILYAKVLSRRLLTLSADFTSAYAVVHVLQPKYSMPHTLLVLRSAPACLYTRVCCGCVNIVCQSSLSTPTGRCFNATYSVTNELSRGWHPRERVGMPKRLVWMGKIIVAS